MSALTLKDLAPQRQDKLRRILAQHEVVHVSELITQIKASPATIRRDLAELERLGELRRTHGGAFRVKVPRQEAPFGVKSAEATEEKQRIALAALKYVNPSETIFLDAGSTVHMLARLLAERTDITVVTRSLPAAAELTAHGPKLVLIGGDLRRQSQGTVGPLAHLALEHLYMDRAFMGASGVSLEQGITTPDPTESYIQEIVMNHARQIILLADSSKAGKVCFARSAPVEKIHVLISDKALDRKFLSELRRRGVEVVVA